MERAIFFPEMEKNQELLCLPPHLICNARDVRD